MKSWLAVLFLLSSATAYCEPRHFNAWTDKEKAEFLAFTILSYIDYRQSRWAIEQVNPDGSYPFEEINPIYGKRPSTDAIIIGQLMGVAGYYTMIALSDDPKFKKYSKISRAITFGFKTAVILNNDYQGISFSKAW